MVYMLFVWKRCLSSVRETIVKMLKNTFRFDKLKLNKLPSGHSLSRITQNPFRLRSENS